MIHARQDWKDQRLYAGIDVHQNKWVVTIRTTEVQLKTFVTAADKQALLQTFRHQWPGATISAVYEAGCFGYHLADFLNTHGIKTIIVAPHTIPTAPGQFVKTDAIDSKKLASEFAKGNLVGIYQRPVEDLYDRSILRKRAQLIKRRVQIQHQIKSDLRFYGVETPMYARPYWSRWRIADMKSIPFNHEYYCQAIQLCVNEYVAVRSQIKAIDQMLISLADSEKYKQRVTLLRTVPGVGRLAALTILVELGDIHRFKNAERFVSYLGLTPSEFSSGESVRKGSLTGMGHTALRSLLVQSAWSAIRKDPVLLLKFQRLCVGKSKCQAIVAVAKSLANRIRKVILSNEPYVIGVV
jgi:transposase